MLVVAVMLGVGVGCGSSSDETGPSVTKAQFVKKANVICADFKGKRLAAAEEEFNPKQREGSHAVGSPATKALEAELEELGEELLQKEIVPSLESEQDALEALGAPEGDDEKIEAMMASMEKGISELEGVGFQGLAGNQFDPFEKEATEYGLKCKVI